jgi:hypothetical protein
MMARTEDTAIKAPPSSLRPESAPRGKASPAAATTVEKEERASLAKD